MRFLWFKYYLDCSVAGNSTQCCDSTFVFYVHFFSSSSSFEWNYHKYICIFYRNFLWFFSFFFFYSWFVCVCVIVVDAVAAAATWTSSCVYGTYKHFAIKMKINLISAVVYVMYSSFVFVSFIECRVLYVVSLLGSLLLLTNTLNVTTKHEICRRKIWISTFEIGFVRNPNGLNFKITKW